MKAAFSKWQAWPIPFKLASIAVALAFLAGGFSGGMP